MVFPLRLGPMLDTVAVALFRAARTLYFYRLELPVPALARLAVPALSVAVRD